MGGQDARKARAGSRDLADPVERFAKPLLHLDTPASATWVTPASISLFSAQDNSVAAQGDAHLTAAHSVSAVSGQTTSLYTHAGGIQAITANAGLSLRAHTDAQQIWSEQDLTVQSTTDEVRIQASKSITLTAGQSQIVIEGGNISFTCPGTWTVKGASHDWLGGGSQAAQLTGMPSGTVSQSPDEVMTAGQYLGKYEMFKTDNRPFVGYDYEIRNSSGKVLASGKTDAAGYAQLLVTPQEEGIKAYKSVKPDSERITENWQGKLGSAAARAQSA